MSDSLKFVTAILATLGILGSVIGGFFRESNPTIPTVSKPVILTEEIIPPPGRRS